METSEEDYNPLASKVERVYQRAGGVRSVRRKKAYTETECSP